MIALRLSEVARITGGQLFEAVSTTDAPDSSAAGTSGDGPAGHGPAGDRPAGDRPAGVAADVLVDGPVVTDSREATEGSLYVARIGQELDGHDFVAAARSRGAVAALTSRPVTDLPSVVVQDVQAAFVSLAHALVQLNATAVVIGVTGSSGKTSTKDLLWSVLQRHGETVANTGSLNSEVGVPLTACRITASTAYLVLEMGSRGIGHITYLTQIARPQIGVVLNVGTAHIGEFGSREAIGRAKAELVQALPATGFAILNADDPIVWEMASQTSASVIGVGESAEATVRALDITVDSHSRASFTLVAPQGRAGVVLGLHGAHHVGNALAVAGVALAVGMPLDEVAAALGDARPLSRWRMEVHERADGVTIVNDAYNANPDSMRAALKALAGMGHRRRTWAVLGEMRELGPEAAGEHQAVGRLAVSLGVSRLVSVGQEAQSIERGARDQLSGAAGPAGTESTWVPDVEAAHQLLRQHLAPGDVVLVKSSHDAGLRWLGDRLVQDAAAPASEVHP